MSHFENDDLIPPVKLLHDGSTSAEEFVLFGDGFLQSILVSRAHLTPTASLLDVGCGNGQIARALTRFLSPPGRYEGVDINPGTITWLRQRYGGHENFRFTHADIWSSLYNPKGRLTAAEYRFPFEDASFDFVLLKSVFTHMFPVDVRAYMSEIGRVLKDGGRSVITYFLLNEESRRCIDRGLAVHPLNLEYRLDPLCRIAKPAMPEFVVAHDESRMRQYYAESGCRVIDVEYGNWRGLPSPLGHQDLVIAVKE